MVITLPPDSHPMHATTQDGDNIKNISMASLKRIRASFGFRSGDQLRKPDAFN